MWIVGLSCGGGSEWKMGTLVLMLASYELLGSNVEVAFVGSSWWYSVLLFLTMILYSSLVVNFLNFIGSLSGMSKRALILLLLFCLQSSCLVLLVAVMSDSLGWSILELLSVFRLLVKG